MKNLKIQLLLILAITGTSTAAKDLSYSENFLCSGDQQNIYVNYNSSNKQITLSGYNDNNQLSTLTVPLFDSLQHTEQYGCLSITEKIYKITTRVVYGEFKITNQLSNGVPRCAGMNFKNITLSIGFANSELPFNGEFFCQLIKY